MRNIKKILFFSNFLHFLSALILVLDLIFILYHYPQLPEKIPMKFDFSSNPTQYYPKPMIFFTFGMLFFCYGIFRLLISQKDNEMIFSQDQRNHPELINLQMYGTFFIISLIFSHIDYFIINISLKKSFSIGYWIEFYIILILVFNFGITW